MAATDNAELRVERSFDVTNVEKWKTWKYGTLRLAIITTGGEIWRSPLSMQGPMIATILDCQEIVMV
jgi:hypothetical protein